MLFQHRSFNIECSTNILDGNYVGRAAISRLPTDQNEEIAFKSRYLKSFPTEQQALDYARFWAERWCDEI
jgi:hypothetical protein